jgi:hypothetical protein
MSTNMPMRDEMGPVLTAEEVAALSKYGRIQLRAHGSGVALREIGELRRDTQATLASARQHLKALQSSAGNARNTTRDFPPNLARELGNVDGDRLTAFLATEATKEQTQFQLQWNTTVRTIEVCELRLRLIDEEEAALKATSSPLLATSGSLRKHLMSTGVLRHEDF